MTASLARAFAVVLGIAMAVPVMSGVGFVGHFAGVPTVVSHSSSPENPIGAVMEAASASLGSEGSLAPGLRFTCGPVVSNSTQCRPATDAPAVGSPTTGDWRQQLNWPTGRSGAAMTYDGRDGRVVLFGDSTGAGYGNFVGLNDTWYYQNGTWSQLHPSFSPPAIRGVLAPYAMVYDRTDGYVLAVGGDVRNQTYAFHGGNWTHLLTPAGPSPRVSFSLTFDSTDGYVVLFGGERSSGSCTPQTATLRGAVFCGDTWKFAHATWTKVISSPSPSPRMSSILGDDPADAAAVLFGGVTVWGRPVNDTWEFRGGHWALIAPPTSPPAGVGFAAPPYAGMAYDPALGSVLLVGVSGAASSWTYQNGSWRSLGPGSATGATASGPPVFDPQGNVVVVLDGSDAYGAPVWTYRNGTYCPAPPGSGFANSSWCFQDVPRVLSLAPAFMVFDGADGEILLLVPVQYLGPYPAVWFYRLWEFDHGAWSWVGVDPKLGPRVAEGAAVAYDARDKCVVVFGGAYWNSAGPTYDVRATWTYAHGNWTRVLPAPHGAWPQPRFGAGLAYDARDRYLLLFGGVTTAGTGLNDSWAFANGSWSRINTPSAPPPRVGFALAYDTADGTAVLYGGMGPSTTPLNDTWTYAAGIWSRVAGAGGPSPRSYPLVTDDPADHGLLLFGGTVYNSYPYDRYSDTWLFSNGTWKNVSSALPHHPNPTDGGASVATYDPSLDQVLLFEGGVGLGVDGGIWRIR